MSNGTNTQLCKAHSGLVRALDDHDAAITELKDKWDKMNDKLIGGLILLVMNLVGVVFLLIKGM